jgi:small-conductance mechanosensitive channel
MAHWNQILPQLTTWLVEYLWRSLGALAVLVVGMTLQKAVSFISWRIRRRRVFHPVDRAVPAIVILGIWVVTAVLMLVVLGVAGPVIGLMVTLGLALGIFADSLGGFRILLSSPFQIGDLLELQGEGLKGIVVQTSLSGIVLETASHSKVIVSNRKLFENPIINHTGQMANVDVSVQLVLGHSVDLDALEQTSRKVAAGVSGFNGGEYCSVTVTRIDSDAVTVLVKFRVARKSGEDPAGLFMKNTKAELDRLAIPVRSLEVLKS